MSGGVILTTSLATSRPSIDGRYEHEGGKFSLDKSIAHAVRKAGYKSLGNGLLVRRGWKSRWRIRIEGNNANDRYHRMAYESSQRNTAAMLAERHRKSANSPVGEEIDLSDAELLKARFYRQDNLRFNPQLRDPEYGLSSGNQRAVRISRWAHYANGITELGAAPTGLLLKISKLLCMPKRAENSMGSQLRVLAALPLVGAAVAMVGTWGIGWSLKNGTKNIASAIRGDIHALVASFSAITALGALLSLGLGAASCIATTRSRLSSTVMDLLQANQSKHLDRLFALIDEVKDKPNGARIISLAMKKKIPETFCDSAGQPVLLSRLIEDVRNSNGKVQATQAMQKTIGSYLTERSVRGDTPNEFLDPEQNKAELLSRENHFLALTNLIEHIRIHEQPDGGFKDVRHRIEDVVEKELRPGALASASQLLKFMGCSNAARTVSKWSSEDYLKKREIDKDKPELACAMRFCADNILKNPHQYGPLTRTLANLSEGLRIVNHSVLLSLNYQLTRPFAWLAGRMTERMFDIPNSRATSFSIGRLVSSSVWAVVDAFLLLSLAAGNGVAFTGPDSGTKLTFPVKVPVGASMSMSIISTAAQMFFVAIPAAILMGAAKGVARLEGWEGDTVRPLETKSQGRDAMRWE